MAKIMAKIKDYGECWVVINCGGVEDFYLYSVEKALENSKLEKKDIIILEKDGRMNGWPLRINKITLERAKEIYKDTEENGEDFEVEFY